MWELNKGYSVCKKLIGGKKHTILMMELYARDGVSMTINMTITLYIISFIALLASFIKSKDNTKLALKKAWKAFENILPQLLAILVIIGVMLALLTPEQISKLLGTESGWLGVFFASAIGSITLIPGFVAFPLAAALLKSGAGYMQIAAFVSTLMMVGIVTMPVEIKYFGKKATMIRNISAFVFSLIVALVMGVFMR